MNEHTFAGVWDAIETKPDEAENMRRRSSLMRTLEQHIYNQSWSKAQAAARLGVTQPCISDLLRGKINLFSLDTLVNMAVSAGLPIERSVQQAAGAVKEIGSETVVSGPPSQAIGQTS